jgi:DNA primase
VALCPFHKEKSPSFNVNPQKQIFHCFGCHKGGDVFTFVKEYESIDFVEAVKRLADRARIPLEYEQGGAGLETKHLKDTLLQIHEQLTQRWHNCLLNEAAGQVARDYLAKRGVSEEAIKLFRIGAAPESWDDTVNWAKGKGFDFETVEKAGLIIRRAEGGGEKGEGGAGGVEHRTSNAELRTPNAEGPKPISEFRRYYDRFRGRLMFPICDEQGRVIGFSGRVLSGDEKTAKYVNSPETPIFTKSKVFFGLDKSKRAILDAGFAIICEGQLDLIACFMGGVQNIVAPQGTAFTDQHARILKRYGDEVVLCFDSDEAGQNAIVRSLDHLLASGLAVRVAVVPRPHDPDSFIKANGGEAFRQLIEKADGFFDYYLNRLCATNEAATDKGRQAILQGMAEAVYKTGNAVLIETYAQKTGQRLSVSEQAVRAEFRRIQKNPHAATHAQEEAEEPANVTPELTRDEFQFLKLLLETDDFVEWAGNQVHPEWFQNAAVQKIFNRRLELHRANGWLGISAFLGDVGDEQQIITKVIAGELIDRNADGTPLASRKQNLSGKQILDVATKLRNQFIERSLAMLKHRANQPELSDEERVELLKQQQELREMKRRPLVAPV